MKYLSTVAFAALSLPAFAGHPIVEDKNFSEPLFGTGLYGAIQAGANVYQDYDNDDVNLFGVNVNVDLDSDTGVFAGLKLGYVFGTGPVRPAVEFDGFYNGFEADAELRGPGGTAPIGEVKFHTGAFLGNFLLRVNCLSRFQPYFGAGAGFFYADVETALLGGDDSTGFAWQLIAGADIYIHEMVSAFVEYKFLNYEELDFRGIEADIRQHLVGVGLRVHF